MKTATVGDVQRNFSRILEELRGGEEITITKRGKPIARLAALGPKRDVEWPDFYDDAIELKGKTLSDLVIEGREERF